MGCQGAAASLAMVDHGINALIENFAGIKRHSR